jgi:quercetin dioxygenase-like cupin family protein
VAPDHYKVEFENDQVRVLRITYAAGDETAMHSHTDGVAVFFSDQNAEFTLQDGTTEERLTKAGDALWIPAETHAPKALTDVSLVLVEIRGGGGDMAMTDTDATAAAPDHYKVEFENDQVRVLRVTYAAGDETTMHSHPDGVVVFLADAEAEMTLPDGSTRESPGKAGDALWAPQETHGVKALTDISVVLVELKGSEGE